MPARAEVLHYTGYDDDRGGIISVIRHLAAAGCSGCVLGVNPSCRQERQPPLRTCELPRMAGEKISPANFWRARAVAQEVRAWLQADNTRVFHGHSRAGLLVGLWLRWLGETRVVVSVHCYGRQRWFYRWAARRLGTRIFWLSPAMRGYYGAPGQDWDQCIPEGVPGRPARPARLPDGELRLGGAGLLVRWKGWHLILEALALLPDGLRQRARFEHIGTAPAEAAAQRYAADLHERTARLGLGGQVRWCGAEPSAERLLGNSDVLVVASKAEPFSVAMLEALAAGVPVLAADSGGARDVICPGVNGMLFRTGDAAHLASQIQRWLEQPPAWDQEKIRGTAIGIDRIARQWAEVYATL